MGDYGTALDSGIMLAKPAERGLLGGAGSHNMRVWHQHVPRLCVCAQATYEVGYGTVLDSGTTFTYLPSDAFTRFREAVTRFALAHGLHVTKGPDPKARAPARHNGCGGGGDRVCLWYVYVLLHVLRQAALPVQQSLCVWCWFCSQSWRC